MTTVTFTLKLGLKMYTPLEMLSQFLTLPYWRITPLAQYPKDMIFFFFGLLAYSS